MVKAKKKKQIAAIVSARKEKEKTKNPIEALKSNPFERKTVRKHHVVLGQKLKDEEVLVGQTRSKATEMRKNSLKLEYDMEGKKNAFIDRRIGEKDESISNEEKMLIRFQKERQKKLLKKNVYSLGEEEGLTHHGQSLSTIESFDDIEGADDDEGMNENIVDEYHFGGFVKKEQPSDKPKTRAEVMQEIIHKSKYYKELKQRQHEENEELVEELDSLLPSLLEHFGTTGGFRTKKTEKDDFDIMVNELSFEPRAYATNPSKTPEQLAAIQREKLTLLEKARLERMSTDFVGDDEQLGEGEEAEDDDDDEEGEEGEEGESGDDEDEGDEDDEDGENEPKKKKRKVDFESADTLEDDFDAPSNFNDENGEGEEGESGEDGEDDEEDEENDDDEEDEDDDFNREERNQKPKVFLTEKELQLVDKNAEEGAIPFLIEIPESYDEFYTLFANRPSKEQSTIISRIFTSNNPSMGPSFQPKMAKLATLLLQHFGKIVNARLGSEDGISSKELSIVYIALSHISQKIPDQFTEICKKKVVSLNTSLLTFLSNLGSGNGEKGVAWRLADFLFFKFLSNIYSVTDFYHPILSPCLLLMNNYIVNVPFASLPQIICKLFLSSVIINYLKEAKRYCSEIVYLYDVLLSAMKGGGDDSSPSQINSTILEFFNLRNLGDKSNNSDDFLTLPVLPLNFALNFANYSTDDHSPSLLCSILGLIIKNLSVMEVMWRNYQCYPEIFGVFVSHFDAFSKFSLPSSLADMIVELKIKIETKIKQFNKTRKPMRFPDAKPVPLPSLIPDFDEGYNPMKKGTKDDVDAEKARIKRLQKTVKKEKRAAIRELRKDNTFLASEKLKKRKLEDAEREKKVKFIMSTLQEQQHNFNVSEKMKSKTKKRK